MDCLEKEVFYENRVHSLGAAQTAPLEMYSIRKMQLWKSESPAQTVFAEMSSIHGDGFEKEAKNFALLCLCQKQ